MIIRSNALALPLRDACVDLIVTSPPYFALRSYQDGGGHYDGQVGSEETPAGFLEALWAATAEMVRVLKPTGSIFVNLGDKYAGSGGHNNANITKRNLAGQGNKSSDRAKYLPPRRNAPDRYNQNAGGIPAKSLMGLPWRYANGVVDRLGLILRRDLIWDKPNGLPESANDRCRTSHEYWFHFVKQGQYFSAIDDLREVYAGDRALSRRVKHEGNGKHDQRAAWSEDREHPLGRLPGSVWTIPCEPLLISEAVRAHYDLPDHFAAFPQEWPRRLILGWSPSGICTACGQGRRPVVENSGAYAAHREATGNFAAAQYAEHGGSPGSYDGKNRRPANAPPTEKAITGYACACDVPIAPTRPAIVLDPFGGTGTVAMVARALGRTGLNGDLSGDYCRLARWRIYQSGHAAKSESRTWRDAQGAML